MARAIKALKRCISIPDTKNSQLPFLRAKASKNHGRSRAATPFWEQHEAESQPYMSAHSGSVYCELQFINGGQAAACMLSSLGI